MSLDFDGLIGSLIDHGVISFGEFRLTSGKLSPYYIDLRRCISYPKLFSLIVDHYLSKIGGLGDFDVIAGVETGSIPYAAVLAYRLGKPMVYVRKRRKEVGAGRRVEGSFDDGSRVLVVEDVVTTGGSVLHAVRCLRDVGGVVDHAVAFIDREEGGADKLGGVGVELVSILKVSFFMRRLYELGYIDRELFASILNYIEVREDV